MLQMARVQSQHRAEMAAAGVPVVWQIDPVSWTSVAVLEQARTVQSGS